MSSATPKDFDIPGSKVFISVVVTCHNEVDTIGATLNNVNQALSWLGQKSEVIVFDDASTDGSKQLIENYVRQTPTANLIFVKIDANRGLVENICDGIRRATGQYFWVVGGDSTVPLSEMKKLLTEVGKADIIIPQVEEYRGRSSRRKLLSKAYSFLVRTLSGSEIQYFNGSSIYLTSDFRDCVNISRGFGYAAESILKLQRIGRSIIEVPVTYDERKEEKSTAISREHLWEIGLFLLRLIANRILGEKSLYAHFMEHISSSSQTLRYLAAAIVIALSVVAYKMFLVPIYWPGGDYLNHVQNAKYMKLEEHGQNAWWQPIGPAIYIKYALLYFENWSLYIFTQGIVLAVTLILIFRTFIKSFGPNKLSMLLAFVFSAIPVHMFLVHIESAQNNLNLFLVATSAYICIKIINTDRPKIDVGYWVLLALLLAAANLVRASGLIIFIAFMMVLMLKSLTDRSFFTSQKIRIIGFVCGYFCLNLAASVVFEDRYEVSDRNITGDLNCYRAYTSDVLNKRYDDWPETPNEFDWSAYRQIKFEFPITHVPQESAAYILRHVPNYSTFRIFKDMYGDRYCDKFRVDIAGAALGFLKRIVVGDVPPRSGRQTLITLQLQGRNGFTENRLLERSTLESIQQELRLATYDITNTVMADSASFIFSQFPYHPTYKLSFGEYFSKYPRNEIAELNRNRIRALAGLETAWLGGGYITILEGYIFTMLSNTAGPLATEMILANQTKTILEVCPTCRLLFLENLVCEFKNLVAPYLPSCKQFKPKKAGVSLGTRINFNAHLPQQLKETLHDEPVNTLDILHSFILYDWGIIAISTITLLSVFVILIRPMTSIRNHALIFLLLVVVGKTMFLGLFAAASDPRRYSDPSRIILLLVFPVAFMPQKPQQRKDKPS